MFDPMKATGLDTLKATRSLEAAGFNAAQAEALVNVLGGPITGTVASKGDMRELRLELKAEIKSFREEIRAEIKDVRKEIKDVREEIKDVREEIRDSREATKAEIKDVRKEIRDSREATKAEIKDVRKEIGDSREATKAEIKDVRKEIRDLREATRAETKDFREETGTEIADLRTQFASLSREVADVRLEVRGGIRSLKAQMYRLLLVQATVIVGLILGLQRLL